MRSTALYEFLFVFVRFVVLKPKSECSAANQTTNLRMMKYQQDPPDSYKASYSCEFHACTKLHEMCTKLRIAPRRNSCVFGSITSRVHEIARQYCDMWVISQAMCTKLHDIMSAPCRHGSHFLEIQSGQIVEFHAHEIARNRFWDIIEFHRKMWAVRAHGNPCPSKIHKNTWK